MSVPALLDSHGLAIPAETIAAVRSSAMMEAAAAFPGSQEPGLASSPAYASGWFDQPDTASWWPSQASADGSVLPHRDLTLARVRDIVRNDETAGTAVERLVDLVVGHGLHLRSRPDAVALGISPDAANELSSKIQAEWRLFGHDPRRHCDAQRKLSINGLFRLFARTSIIAGEATGLNTWRDTPGGRYSTCVLAVDPDRVSNPSMQIDTNELRGGVEMDSFGAPVAYHVRNAHAGDWWAYGKQWTWTRVPRATEWGRPVFFHGFEPEREGQTRAISPFASLVRGLRMVNKFSSNELASAAANALFAAFVESDLPVDDVNQKLQPQASTYSDKMATYFEKNPARLNGVRIPVMPPGTKISINGSPRQTTAFPAFQAAFLQKIAARLGISYEQLTMDWTKTNYSSARAALAEVWRHIQRLRATFTEQIVTPIFYAFLEEAFDRGYIKAPAGAPDFWDMPGAYLRAIWIGPGRGYIDPVKEAQASAIRMDSLTSTLEIECAEQGLDYEDVLDQREREELDLKARNLVRPSLEKIYAQMSEQNGGDGDEPASPAREKETA